MHHLTRVATVARESQPVGVNIPQDCHDTILA